jgi:hypothetical protein
MVVPLPRQLSPLFLLSGHELLGELTQPLLGIERHDLLLLRAPFEDAKTEGEWCHDGKRRELRRVVSLNRGPRRPARYVVELRDRDRRSSS